MSLYEVLKASKLGGGAPDYWTELFARRVAGGWTVSTITGTLPITFRSNGTALIDYRIYGTADGAGVETENLFDPTATDTSKGYANNSVIYYNGNVGASTAVWCVSEYLDIKDSTTLLLRMKSDNIGTAQSPAIVFYDSSKARISGVQYDAQQMYNIIREFNVPNGANFVRFSAFKGENTTVELLKNITQQTAPITYIPYGNKLTLTLISGTESKTNDVYIGDSKLLSGDYIDYESGKIYKAKRIHEDTVTIDGIVWDILGYDHDEVYKADGTRAKHTVTIQTHDIINNLQYSARQAAFAFPNGLAAGTYHFTVGEQPNFVGDVGKVLTFTLANAIPSGGQLVFNDAHNKTLVGTTITAFASPTSTTAVETVTMTEGSTGTDLGTILRSKTDTVNSIDRVFLGSNNWIESAMRQYLNSDKAAGNVWTPQTVFDRPPSWAGTASGFLNGKSTNFVSHIGTAKKTTALHTETDGGGTVESDEKFFLLSRSEVYGGD